MSKIYHIFVPEYVPLENKGEEAIIRGMGDVLFPEGNVEFHFLDMLASRYRYVDGLHVYPGTWFYSKWRSQEFGLGLSLDKIYSSACSLLRNGLNTVMPNWVKFPQRPLMQARDRFHRIRSEGSMRSDDKDLCLSRILGCDFLIAGHDGALNEYDCHVIEVMLKQGMEFGIFGTSMKPNVKNRAIIEVFAETLPKAKFIYCRNEIAVEWAQKHFKGLNIQLAPDPAFGMKPCSEDRVKAIIETEGLESFFKRPVVMLTSAEPSPIARHSFCTVSSPEEKLNVHRELLSRLIRHIVNNHQLNVMFLPHAIGPLSGLDDRLIARDVLRRAQLPDDRAMVLETEYSARELKGLLGKADLLVAERLHSIIGAVGVHTPFMCLGSNTDTRVRGIVGRMLEAEDLTYLLNYPVETELYASFDAIWEQRESLRRRMRDVSAKLQDRLNEVGVQMRGWLK